MDLIYTSDSDNFLTDDEDGSFYFDEEPGEDGDNVESASSSDEDVEMEEEHEWHQAIEGTDDRPTAVPEFMGTPGFRPDWVPPQSANGSAMSLSECVSAEALGLQGFPVAAQDGSSTEAEGPSQSTGGIRAQLGQDGAAKLADAGSLETIAERQETPEWPGRSPQRFNPFDTDDRDQLRLVEEADARSEQSSLRRCSTREEEPASDAVFISELMVQAHVEQSRLEPFHPPYDAADGWLLWARLCGDAAKASWTEVRVRLTSEPSLELLDEATDRVLQVIRLDASQQVGEDVLKLYEGVGRLHTFKLSSVRYAPEGEHRADWWSLRSLQQAIVGSRLAEREQSCGTAKVQTVVMKFGSAEQYTARSLAWAIEDSLMRISDATPQPPPVECAKESSFFCAYLRDEFEAMIDREGQVMHRKWRTRLFFLAVVAPSDAPSCVELALNDRRRREAERSIDSDGGDDGEWVGVLDAELHARVEARRYRESRVIRFQPVPSCRLEAARVRTVPGRDEDWRLEPPLRLACRFVACADGNLVNIRCALTGQREALRRRTAAVASEVEIRVPLPEVWLRHFRLKSSSPASPGTSGSSPRLERLAQLISQQSEPQTVELKVSAGSAQYHDAHRGLVWRIERLPADKLRAGCPEPQQLDCSLRLPPGDLIPDGEALTDSASIEFSLPDTFVSGCSLRRFSVDGPDGPADRQQLLERRSAKFSYSCSIDYRGLGDQRIVVGEPAENSMRSRRATFGGGGGGVGGAKFPGSPRSRASDLSGFIRSLVHINSSGAEAEGAARGEPPSGAAEYHQPRPRRRRLTGGLTDDSS